MSNTTKDKMRLTIIMNRSSMSLEEKDEFIQNLSKVLGVTVKEIKENSTFHEGEKTANLPPHTKPLTFH